ncbi:MAG TPA: hypothetical protein VN203_06545, partial [Candidatus Acidoferrum sp.]|nr:hypothetical protein [Candidatus Acidoferrum sp.]
RECLRHTYASLALQRGVPLLTVSRQLGHGSIAITADVYGHLAPEATREAATTWDAILTEHFRNPRATTTVDPAQLPETPHRGVKSKFLSGLCSCSLSLGW